VIREKFLDDLKPASGVLEYSPETKVKREFFGSNERIGAKKCYRPAIKRDRA
jgi:hypothetical protein